MSFLRSRAWLSLLALALLLVPLTVLAQDDAIRIDGSRIVADMIAPVVETLEANVNLEISGSNNGLARLCNGEIDIATTTGAITRDQDATCAANDITWVEVPIGYDALAVVSNPAITTAQCMTLGELSALFGPAASGTVTSLSQVNAAWGATAIQVYAPAVDSTAVNLLDSLLPGDGLRTDFTTEADADTLLAAVAADAGGLGIAPLAATFDGSAELNTIALDDLGGNGCVEPGAETLADGSYPGARGMYLYVNAASLEREDVQTLLSAMVGDVGQTAVAGVGFVTLGEDLAASAVSNIAAGVTGRQFSQAEPLYAIPLDVKPTAALPRP
jgi:ABC-type phosphate transport system substrate-binding protein